MTRDRTTYLLATGLAVLSVGFAGVHAAWAAGWRAGVPQATAPIGDRPVFLTYDVTAGLLMVGAGVVALLLANGARGRWRTATLVGSRLALARDVPALGIDLATGDLGWHVGPLVDLWFTVAGSAGLLLWWRTRPARRRAPTPDAGAAA